MHEQHRQQQGFVFRADADEATALIEVGLLDALAEIRFVLIHQAGHGVVVAGIVDQHIVWQQGLADGGARFAIDAELSRAPGYLCFLATDFILDGALETKVSLLFVVFVEVAKYLDQRLKQVRLATPVFAATPLAGAPTCPSSASRNR